MKVTASVIIVVVFILAALTTGWWYFSKTPISNTNTTEGNVSSNTSKTANTTPITKGDFSLTTTTKGVFVNNVRIPQDNTAEWPNVKLIDGGTGPLAMWYAHDAKNVYCGDSENVQTITSADMSTFSVLEIQLGDFTFAKDAGHVYLGCKELNDADPKTFSVTHNQDNSFTIRDKNKIWFRLDENFNTLD